MAQVLVRSLYEATPQSDMADITVSGWVRTTRESKSVAFVEVNDGSCFKNLQVIVEEDKLHNYRDVVKALNVGAALRIILCRKNVIRWNICAPFNICGPGQTCSNARFGCVPSPRRPSIVSSMTRAFCMCTRP